MEEPRGSGDLPAQSIPYRVRRRTSAAAGGDHALIEDQREIVHAHRLDQVTVEAGVGRPESVGGLGVAGRGDQRRAPAVLGAQRRASS